MKVRVSGTYFGTSGYAAHVRGLVKGLFEAGADVRCSTQLVPGWERQVSDWELAMFKKPDGKDEVLIWVGTPPSWRFGLAERKKAFIGCCVWEGDRIPAYWLPYMLDERVQQIWVPSQHTAKAVYATALESDSTATPLTKALQNEGIFDNRIKPMDKIRLVPHGFDAELFKPLPKPAGVSRPFTFLVNKGWVHDTEDRGGVQYVVKAFHDEFEAGEPVRLLIKLNAAYGVAPPNQFNRWVGEKLRTAGAEPPKMNIVVTASDIPYKQMASLYAEADVFVCATRAEAFNIPGLEAHACGIPTIQTGYGGQTDYMIEGVDSKIDYKLVSVVHDPAYEGVQWATPDVASLRSLMRSYFKSGANRCIDIGKVALESTKDKTWLHVGKQALEHMKDL